MDKNNPPTPFTPTRKTARYRDNTLDRNDVSPGSVYPPDAPYPKKGDPYHILPEPPSPPERQANRGARPMLLLALFALALIAGVLLTHALLKRYSEKAGALGGGYGAYDALAVVPLPVEAQASTVQVVQKTVASLSVTNSGVSVWAKRVEAYFEFHRARISAAEQWRGEELGTASAGMIDGMISSMVTECHAVIDMLGSLYAMDQRVAAALKVKANDCTPPREP